MNKNLKLLIYIALLASILSVTAPLSFNIGTVPITLATFSVYLIGGLTKKWHGILAVLVYIVLGIIGIPVFSNFRGGLGVIVGATGGYIIGYLPCVLIISLITSINKKKIYWYPLGIFLGTIVCYLFGSIWFMIVMNYNFIDTLKVCVVPFILFDLVKLVLASIVSWVLNYKMDFDNLYNL